MAWTTPITHATGDVVPASDWNTYIRDNTNLLFGDTNWTTATLQNSATAGSIAPGFRLDGRSVKLRGIVAAYTASFSAQVFTLPVGYRPAQNFQSFFNNNGVYGQIFILTTGGVCLASGSTNGFLDGVSVPIG